MIGRHFVTRVSLEYNDCMITEYRPITDRIVLYDEYGCDDIYKELIKSLYQRIRDKKTND